MPGAQAHGADELPELAEQQERRAVRHEQRVADDPGHDALDRREHLRVGGREHDGDGGKPGSDRLDDDGRPGERVGRRREREDEREQRGVGSEREREAQVDRAPTPPSRQARTSSAQRDEQVPGHDDRRRARARTRASFAVGEMRCSQPRSLTADRSIDPMFTQPTPSSPGTWCSWLGERAVPQQPRAHAGHVPEHPRRDERLEEPAERPERVHDDREALDRQRRVARRRGVSLAVGSRAAPSPPANSPALTTPPDSGFANVIVAGSSAPVSRDGGRASAGERDEQHQQRRGGRERQHRRDARRRPHAWPAERRDEPAEQRPAQHHLGGDHERVEAEHRHAAVPEHREHDLDDERRDHREHGPEQHARDDGEVDVVGERHDLARHRHQHQRRDDREQRHLAAHVASLGEPAGDEHDDERQHPAAHPEPGRQDAVGDVDVRHLASAPGSLPAAHSRAQAVERDLVAGDDEPAGRACRRRDDDRALGRLDPAATVADDVVVVVRCRRGSERTARCRRARPRARASRSRASRPRRGRRSRRPAGASDALTTALELLDAEAPGIAAAAWAMRWRCGVTRPAPYAPLESAAIGTPSGGADRCDRAPHAYIHQVRIIIT